MKRLIFFLLIIPILGLEAKAISVASDYLPNSTLEIIEGSSKIYSIRLQNPTNDEVGIKLDYDNEFIKVIDYKEIYVLQPRETGYKILFNITAPKKIGLYPIGYTVSEVEPAGGGGLPIRLKINRNFNVKVIKKPGRYNINYKYAAYAAIAAIFLLYVFRKKYFDKRKLKLRKRKRKSRKS